MRNIWMISFLKKRIKIFKITLSLFPPKEYVYSNCRGAAIFSDIVKLSHFLYYISMILFSSSEIKTTDKQDKYFSMWEVNF